MQLGVIGLGTMGANLARNAASRGARVAVYNRTTEKTDEFLGKHAAEGEFIACHTFQELKDALTPPRAILLMVKAGPAVDEVMREVLPFLDKGDILIDAGNSHYRDTERREKEMKEAGIHFFGMGVSGGEEGALKGPSMMPGGDPEAYAHMEPLLRAMAADDGAGGKCVAHAGPGGAGHFVKMVHNGIEYALMQLIAETYDVLRRCARVGNKELAQIFGEWSTGDDIGSFLLEITADIFRKKDPETGKDLIDLVGDRAGQKGTGKWTTEAAMDLGAAIPVINAAVDARIISGDTGMRETGRHMPFQGTGVSEDPRVVVALCRSALELSTILAYEQGFVLIAKASDAYGWKIQLPEMARIWRGGCIIRSVLLPGYQKSLSAGGEREQQELVARFTGKRQSNWRTLIGLAAGSGVPVPALCASLAYYDAYRADRLPQNLIQAQRDCFGAHTFERTDKPGAFHADWQS
jgi:6-phosphogluconate dehydrogenase